MKNKNTTYLISGLVILVVAMLAGYFLGSAFSKPNSGDLVMYEGDYANGIGMDKQDQDGMEMEAGEEGYMEEGMETADLGEEFSYVNEELGFSLTLPEKFNVLVAEASQYEASSSVEFSLPLETNSPEEGPTSQMVLAIVRVDSGKGVSEVGPAAQLIAESENGYEYYFFTPFDMVIMESQPEYEVFMSLGTAPEILSFVKVGFRLL